MELTPVHVTGCRSGRLAGDPGFGDDQSADAKDDASGYGLRKLPACPACAIALAGDTDKREPP